MEGIGLLNSLLSTPERLFLFFCDGGAGPSELPAQHCWATVSAFLWWRRWAFWIACPALLSYCLCFPVMEGLDLLNCLPSTAEQLSLFSCDGGAGPSELPAQHCWATVSVFLWLMRCGSEENISSASAVRNEAEFRLGIPETSLNLPQVGK